MMGEWVTVPEPTSESEPQKEPVWLSGRMKRFVSTTVSLCSTGITRGYVGKKEPFGADPPFGSFYI